MINRPCFGTIGKSPISSPSAPSRRKPLSHSARQAKNVVYITVERLAHYARRFDIYHALLEESDFWEFQSWFAELRDRRDDPSAFDLGGPFAGNYHHLAAFGLSEREIALLQKLDLTRLQAALLRHNGIDAGDRPGGRRTRFAVIREIWEWLRAVQPFAIDVRGLPERGESKQFKADIRAQFRTLMEKRQTFKRFVVPLELDVQVPMQNRALPTDLDNVMRYTAPAFTEELLEGEAYLHAYRIYAVRPRNERDRMIRVKLLPEGAIHEFEESMDESLGHAREWLREKMRGY